MENKYYPKKKKVILIGCSLSNMACAMKLAKSGINDILIIEQHNMPGGVATSFVRGGVEFEASLHEMMSIGNHSQLATGQFFKDMGIDIDWIPINEAYRLITPEYNVLIHAGKNGEFENTAKEIASVCTEENAYESVLTFLNLCMKVHEAVDAMGKRFYSKPELLTQYPDLVRCAGYSAKECMDACKVPSKAQEVLSAYWVYVGNRPSELSMILYGYLLADYLGFGPSIPKYTSHEMSLKMAEKCIELGVQIEFSQRVEKILVTNGQVKGVKLASGETIESEIVISGAYPNTVYSKMIEPSSEVPVKAKKITNFRKMSLSAFSVVLLLEGTPEELNIHDYSMFCAKKGMDFDTLWMDSLDPMSTDYITAICNSLVNPDCSPKGTTVYSITAMPRIEAWQNVKEEDYDSMKTKVASLFIDEVSKRLGVNLKDHIKEIVIETPISISHYTGAYLGGVYGYLHTMNDTVVARLAMHMKENYIDGLFFAGAHQVSGDGMSPCITNGITASKEVLAYVRKKEGK